jgi:hypothetical protein
MEAVVLLFYQRRLGHDQGEMLSRHTDLE